MATELQSGADAQAFEVKLRGVDGETHSLSSIAGRVGTVIVFIGTGCPTARAYEDRFMRLSDSCRANGISFVAINSNNAALSPPDTFAEMAKRARDRHFNFPYLKDADGSVARHFGAICTPHAFLLDRDRAIVYRGRIDDSRLGNTITSRDLENATADLVANRPIGMPQTEPFGCSIVW